MADQTDGWIPHATRLEVVRATSDQPFNHDECDGCGNKIGKSSYITNIESCCGGGCCRSLCAACVKAAAKMIEED